MSLRAPLRVPVEVRAAERRCFRLSRSVGVDGVRLERAAPFEPERPVDVTFALPDGAEALHLRAVVQPVVDDVDDGGDDGDGERGGRELAFSDPPAGAREALARYVTARLALPPLPGAR